MPANRFEQIECLAALAAVNERDLDGDPRGPGPLDVLCQHNLSTACAGPFDADALYAEVVTAGPYRMLARADFDAVWSSRRPAAMPCVPMTAGSG